jgi:PTH1 family peptidyl-tRNA hydrolase
VAKPEKLVVGLGNPGAEYARTRHNTGWRVVDAMAENEGTSWRTEADYQADISEADTYWLVKPQTFMNASGESVAKLARFYKIQPDHVLIVSDDLDLPLGTSRFRESGSAGGQKGLDDIIRQLGTDEIPRLRVGIGRPPARMSATDHVLGRFTAEEEEQLTEIIVNAVNQIKEWAGE